MSLEKAIQSGKERRRPHYGAAAVDHSCRNHGSCPWCMRNRTQQLRRERERAERMIEEFWHG